MKKLLMVSGLMLLSGFAAADEVGKVISSTPVMREKQTIGYKVVYEYAGKRYTTQLPQDPGATVNLQITPSAASQPVPRAAPVAARSEPIYEDRWDADRDRPYRVVRSTEGWDADRDQSYATTVYTAPRYVERVYVEPSYYAPGRYYAPTNYGYNYGYSSAPLWPLLGLSIGLASSYRGYGAYGGYYGHRGHNHGGHRGHHRGW